MNDHNHEHTHLHEHNHTHEHAHEHEHNHEHSHDHSHDHEHIHNHEHGHTHAVDENDKKDTTQIITLLKYMLHHNEQHTQELLDMSSKLQNEGFQESAEMIRDCVDAYQDGNQKLAQALKLTDK